MVLQFYSKSLQRTVFYDLRFEITLHFLFQESCRSSHYVPMDFSGGKSGRIVTAKDMPGQTTKEGYTYFRRKIEAQNVEHLLTETQANIHKDQPWFHKNVSRDLSQKILASHSVDG